MSDPAPHPEPLWAQAQHLAGARVLVVGDVMLDHFVYGEVDRISPEAPIPVLRRSRSVQMLGGAGNVAANVASLGGEPALAAVTGADRDAEEVSRLLAQGGLAAHGLVADSARATSVKTRYIAHNQQVLRFDCETIAPLGEAPRAALMDAFGAALAQAGAVVLSDYGKGVLDDGVAQAVIARARAAGRPVLVDPKGADYARYAGADVLTPNLKELREATGLPVDADDEVERAARSLIARFDVGAVVATRSEKGLSVVQAGGAVHIPTQAQEVFDVSGAGDTVVAALGLALARGLPLERAAALANAAAGVAVSKAGTAQVSAAELVAALRASEAAEPGDGASPEAVVEGWRARGLSIGFTNGCFDLLHPGHVSLLAQARGFCDRLVVGLNSDASVRRLKGEGRPINDQAARAQVLAALRAVDLVVVFEEDTPQALIARLAPDVLVKGADYRLDQVVGAELVLARGGRVELARLTPGQSTTAIAGRIAAAR